MNYFYFKDETGGGKGSRSGTPNNVKAEENGDSGKYDISIQTLIF